MIDQNELGRRLRLAREACQLSQEEVANRLGLNRLSYGHMELGKRSVSSLELGQLAYLFGRNMADFVSGDFNDTQDPLSAIFRAQPDVAQLPGVVDTLRECLHLGRELSSLEKQLDLPRSLQGAPRYEWASPRSRWDAIEQGAQAAAEERRRLNLGVVPLGDMAEFLEMRGVRVAVRDLPADISGVTLGSEDTGTFVVVNRKDSRERRRFSHAHEYAHVLFDRQVGGLVSREQDRADLLEVRANAFASRFLVPDEGLRHMLAHWGKGLPGRGSQEVPDGGGSALRVEGREESGSQHIQLLEVVQLAHHFGVSRATVLYRLKHLKLLTEAQLQALQAQDREQGVAMAKLLGLEAPPEAQEASRNAFRRSVLTRAFEAYRRERISRKKLLQLATTLGGVPLEEVQTIVEALDEAAWDSI